jgi:hypothetical protein
MGKRGIRERKQVKVRMDRDYKFKWVVKLGSDSRKSGVQICWVLKSSFLSYMDPRALGFFSLPFGSIEIVPFLNFESQFSFFSFLFFSTWFYMAWCDV